MSKVLLISGSPKPEGNTAQLMEECAKVICEKGVQAGFSKQRVLDMENKLKLSQRAANLVDIEQGDT